MSKYTWMQWQKKRCEKLGHDWAYQDCDQFMAKVCLRCRTTICFFPEETDQEVDE